MVKPPRNTGGPQRGPGRTGRPEGAARPIPRGPRRDSTQKPYPAKAPRAAAPTAKDPTLPAREGERIAKLLARAGVASRREAERMIAEGRVKLGQNVIATPAPETGRASGRERVCQYA